MTARILVVDDTPVNVKLLEAKLQAEYFDILTASDGPSAIEVAQSQAPDLILLDVMMPGMDGFEVARHLKADPKTSHIPIVMVTALTDRKDRVRGLEAGADDFLSKPVNDIALFARVRSLARIKVMLDELRVRHAASRELGAALTPAAIDLGAEVHGKILLVESIDFTANKIVESLSAVGHSVLRKVDGRGALAAAMEDDFDLIIVNLYLAGEDGLRLCSQFRSSEETRHLPILLVLDEGDLESLAKGLDLGVTDYLVKPIDKNELVARVRTQIRHRRYHHNLRTMVKTSVSMAYTDPLTGVYNRRYMNAHLDRKIVEITDTNKPISLVIFDLDHFKSINDTYGHAAGDDVLTGVARRVGDSIRNFDLMVRYGGEEFVVIMPSTSSDVAQSVAERLRAGIADKPFPISGHDQPLAVSASFGVATTEDPSETAESLLGRADRALYAAKAKGRNRVVLAAPAEMPEGALSADRALDASPAAVAGG